jgi:hypothetical protein
MGRRWTGRVLRRNIPPHWGAARVLLGADRGWCMASAKKEAILHEWEVPTADSSGRWTPSSEEDRDEIRQQLARVLASPPFGASKRYPAFLSHVVEKTLQGDTEALKERTLGIQVFHREPNYDTSTDPVVRIAAGEVRKRLAQYYYQPSHRLELLIELPSGTYIPEFYLPSLAASMEENSGNAAPKAIALEEHSEIGISAAAVAPLAPIAALPSDIARAAGAAPKSRRWRWLVPAASVIFGIALGSIGARLRTPVDSAAAITALDEFWRPVISAPGSVWLCIGQVYAQRIELEPNGARNRFDFRYSLTSNGQRTYPMLNLADSTTLARVAGLLEKRNKSYTVHGETETTFADLTNGPSVLIGAYNNDWAIRLSDQLRYHFETDPNTRGHWIVDSQKPDQKIGLHAFGSTTTADVSDAYALISRVRDPSTGQISVALGGVSTNGTRAAATFISNLSYLEEFARQAPANWQNANLQIVIAAPIVDGSLGTPRAVYSYVW